MRYLRDGARSADCVFCSRAESVADADNLLLWRGESAFIIMNLYPYATGHIMIAPYDHVASPELIDPESMSAIAALLPPAMRALRRVLNCQGFNTGMNTGATAGAGIADHMHLHVVPRWSGDANFMPIVANVTVMPETLSVTYAKLRAELERELGSELDIEQLVVSATGDAIVVRHLVELEDHGGHPGDHRPVAVQIQDTLDELGLEVALAGWVGDGTLVWQSRATNPLPSIDWLPVDKIPETIRTRLLEAQRLL